MSNSFLPASLPIASLVDKSFADVRCLHVKMENGYTLSIIQGGGSYSGDGTFELAMWGDGDLLYDRAGFSGDVLGWQSIDEVKKVALAVACLPPIVAEVEG